MAIAAGAILCGMRGYQAISDWAQSLSPKARRLLQVNRGHWSIENSCHYILDWNYDEDRSRTGHGPENITRPRRFAIGVIKSMRGRFIALAFLAVRNCCADGAW